jgi:hypothetical protein
MGRRHWRRELRSLLERLFRAFSKRILLGFSEKRSRHSLMSPVRCVRDRFQRSLRVKATYDRTHPPILGRRIARKTRGGFEGARAQRRGNRFFTRESDGKFEANAKAWDEKAVYLADQMLEVRMLAGRLRIPQG